MQTKLALQDAVYSSRRARETPMALSAANFTCRAHVSLYQRPFTVTQQGDSICVGEVIPWCGEDLRHASSREDADGFLSQ
jgi:hypothetical protein